MLGFEPIGSQAIGGTSEAAGTAPYIVSAAGRATGMSNVFGSGKVIYTVTGRSIGSSTVGGTGGFAVKTLSVNDKITLQILPAFTITYVSTSFTISVI